MTMTTEQLETYVNTLDRDEAIQRWQEAKVQSAAAQNYERMLRERIVTLGFPTEAANASHEGTSNIDLGGGWKLKAVFGQSYNLPKFDDVRRVMTAIRELGTVEAQDAYRNLIKYSPELSISAYRKTSGDVKKLIDEIITLKRKMTSLELVPPKDQS